MKMTEWELNGTILSLFVWREKHESHIQFSSFFSERELVSPTSMMEAGFFLSDDTHEQRNSWEI